MLTDNFFFCLAFVSILRISLYLFLFPATAAAAAAAQEVAALTQFAIFHAFYSVLSLSKS